MKIKEAERIIKQEQSAEKKVAVIRQFCHKNQRWQMREIWHLARHAIRTAQGIR